MGFIYAVVKHQIHDITQNSGILASHKRGLQLPKLFITFKVFVGTENHSLGMVCLLKCRVVLLPLASTL